MRWLWWWRQWWPWSNQDAGSGRRLCAGDAGRGGNGGGGGGSSSVIRAEGRHTVLATTWGDGDDGQQGKRDKAAVTPSQKPSLPPTPMPTPAQRQQFAARSATVSPERQPSDGNAVATRRAPFDASLAGGGCNEGGTRCDARCTRSERGQLAVDAAPRSPRRSQQGRDDGMCVTVKSLDHAPEATGRERAGDVAATAAAGAKAAATETEIGTDAGASRVRNGVDNARERGSEEDGDDDEGGEHDDAEPIDASHLAARVRRLERLLATERERRRLLSSELFTQREISFIISCVMEEVQERMERTVADARRYRRERDALRRRVEHQQQQQQLVEQRREHASSGGDKPCVPPAHLSIDTSNDRQATPDSISVNKSSGGSGNGGGSGRDGGGGGGGASANSSPLQTPTSATSAHSDASQTSSSSSSDNANSVHTLLAEVNSLQQMMSKSLLVLENKALRNAHPAIQSAVVDGQDGDGRPQSPCSAQPCATQPPPPQQQQPFAHIVSAREHLMQELQAKVAARRAEHSRRCGSASQARAASFT